VCVFFLIIAVLRNTEKQEYNLCDNIEHFFILFLFFWFPFFKNPKTQELFFLLAIY